MFSKKSQMTEAGRFDFYGHFTEDAVPGVRQSFPVAPFAVAGAVTDKFGYGSLPFAFGEGGFPEGIECRADNAVWTNLFEFFQISAVKQNIFVCHNKVSHLCFGDDFTPADGQKRAVGAAFKNGKIGASARQKHAAVAESETLRRCAGNGKCSTVF